MLLGAQRAAADGEEDDGSLGMTAALLGVFVRMLGLLSSCVGYVRFVCTGRGMMRRGVNAHRRSRCLDTLIGPLTHTGTSVMMALQVHQSGGGRALTLGKAS